MPQYAQRIVISLVSPALPRHLCTMARKIEKGDRVKVSGEVTRVGDDDCVTIYIRGYSYPITLPARVLEDVKPAPKEPPQRRPKNFYDKPT